LPRATGEHDDAFLRDVKHGFRLDSAVDENGLSPI
jgi:hypothetical protein